MKYLFLSLFLLNILYALWQLQGHTSTGQGQAEESASDVLPPLSTASVPPRPASQMSAGPVSALCVTLGRFDGVAEAEQLRQRMLALDIAAEVKTREMVVGTDYWLAMPVVGSGRDAVLQLTALQERGVDSFLITRGEMAGQLSLGVFEKEEYAHLRRERLQEMGLDVNVHALSKTRQLFLVQVGGEARRLVDQAMLTRLRADFPSLQHQYQPCAGVANGARIP